MNFVSLSFGVYLCIVIFLISKTVTIKQQRYILLFFSLLFYSWWDIRFTILLLFAIGVSYVCTLGMVHNEVKRKQYCYVGVIVLLGILGMFKYYNFFVDSFCNVFQVSRPMSIKIVLPVGISFYTFQAISYIVDVYNGNILPTNDFSKVALYIDRKSVV